MKILIMVFAMVTSPVLAQAYTMKFDEIERVRVVVDNVLNNGGEAYTMYGLIPDDARSFTAALVLLQTLTPNLTWRGEENLHQQRQVLKMITAVLPELTPSQKELLRLRMEPVLMRFKSMSSGGYQVTIEIYDRYDLWSKRELWFLLPKAADYSGVRKFYDPLLKVGRELNGSERTRLEQALGRNQMTASTLMLLYELEMLPDSRLPLFLKRLSKEVLPRHALYGAFGSAAEHYDRVFIDMIPVLEDLQRRYIAQEASVVGAVEKVLGRTSDPVERGFYEMFQEERFQNVAKQFPKMAQMNPNDPLGLLARHEARLAEIERLKPHPAITSREDNLIAVQFGPPNCMALFTK